MGKPQVTVTQLQMYCKMVEDDFAPLEEMLKQRVQILKPAIEQQARRALGIYSLSAEQAALQTRLAEIKAALKDYTERTYDKSSGGYRSKIERETDRRMGEINEPLKKVERVRHDIVREIQMAFVPDEVKTAFGKVETLVKGLTEEMSSLPPIEAMQQQLEFDPNVDVEGE